ncbi:MAG: HisA/HisF-related TIM barrel protein, partial [Clostridiales bacterium]|nr:HisA/HisF-related TIM barrel protein [Clostridiales bacterium]
MKNKKIIPCLDIKNGKVVKGVKFEGIQEIADPIELAEFYDKSGADELVFYDIAASVEGRGIFLELFKEIASKVTIPLIAGGGISTIEDVDLVFKHGAQKVSINSGAIKNPQLIKEAADKYG